MQWIIFTKYGNHTHRARFFWNIVGGILTTLIFALFKKSPAVEGSFPRMKIESIGETGGCAVAFLSFAFFVYSGVSDPLFRRCFQTR